MGRPATHGLSHTPTYTSWRAMRVRCHDPKHDNYRHYGAKGIMVCDRWKDFQNFLADMGIRPSKSHTIDRLDLSGDYEPKNCRWATKIEQGNNHSKNHHVEYRGQRMTMTQAWCLSGKIVPKGTLKSRIYGGWPIDQALETPAVMGRNQWTQNYVETIRL